jgi:citrate lyase beta subunit
MRVRRALLFMPGDDRRKIEKGAALGVDSVIMDLEDGVALSRKPAARETIAAALREVDFGKTERLVRINPVGSVFNSDDLAATIDGHPDGYVLPKVETGEAVRAVDAWLRAAERERGWPEGGIALLTIIETALGVVNLRGIAGLAPEMPRLGALVFGAEDLAGDMGAVRTPDGWEGFYARSAVVLHAKAFGLQAIDTPYVHLDDEAGLVAQTEQALYMGYTGKLAIHPKQVVPIQHTFTPSAEEIRRAQALIAAHGAHQAAGAGVFQLEGKMVDMPMVRAAEAVIARARAAGFIADEHAEK